MGHKKGSQSVIMGQHIAACKEKGTTVEGYCQEQGIKPSTYYYWRKKLLPQAAGKFVQVSAPVLSTGVSILFPNGHRISFETLPPVAYVKHLVS